MTAHIGPEQLRFLIVMGSPTMIGFAMDRPTRALLRRGLVALDGGSKHAVRITAAGLRALADAMEDGRVDTALAAMRADMRRKASA